MHPGQLLGMGLEDLGSQLGIAPLGQRLAVRTAVHDVAVGLLRWCHERGLSTHSTASQPATPRGASGGVDADRSASEGGFLGTLSPVRAGATTDGAGSLPYGGSSSGNSGLRKRHPHGKGEAAAHSGPQQGQGSAGQGATHAHASPASPGKPTPDKEGWLKQLLTRQKHSSSQA